MAPTTALVGEVTGASAWQQMSSICLFVFQSPDEGGNPSSNSCPMNERVPSPFKSSLSFGATWGRFTLHSAIFSVLKKRRRESNDRFVFD